MEGSALDRCLGLPLWLAVLVVPGGSLAAGVHLKGRAYDGEASAGPYLEQFRQTGRPDPEAKVALPDLDLLLERLPREGAPGRSWQARTDGTGSFDVETDIEVLAPEDLFVASAEVNGKRMYSPCFKVGAAASDVHLYPTSAQPSGLNGKVQVVHDVVDGAGEKRVRVRVSVQLLNLGSVMYVGEPGRSRTRSREILRLPVPPGARVTRNTGPLRGTHWRPSDDGRWLVVDQPIPGVLDFGPDQPWRSGEWSVHYELPPRQHLVLSYSFPFALTPERFSFLVWHLHKDMKVVSPDLATFETSQPDPLGETAARFDSWVPRHSVPAQHPVVAALEIDNAVVGQVSRRALRWIGGFVLVSVVAILLGLALSRKAPPPEVMLEGLHSDQVLDRIAELDARHDRGEIRDREYHRYREALVQIAAEEIAGSGDQGAPVRALPAEISTIAGRIAELDERGDVAPAAIQERTQLLEALYKAVRKAGV